MFQYLYFFRVNIKNEKIMFDIIVGNEYCAGNDVGYLVKYVK